MVVSANHKESEVHDFSGRSPELIPQPPFQGVLYSLYKQKGGSEPVPDSFPETSRTSLAIRFSLPELLVIDFFGGFLVLFLEVSSFLCEFPFLTARA